MKNFYLKSLLFLVLLMYGRSAIAYNCIVDGIYYFLHENEAWVTCRYYWSSDDWNESDYSGDIVIPSSVTYNGTTYSVTKICDNAFYGCSDLTSVTIPASVTDIGYGFDYGEEIFHDSAFEGCSGLTSIVVAEGNPIYDSRENCNAIIETASNTLITGCKNTFIPESVTSIGKEAFSGCSGLASITISNNVTSIGEFAFVGCSGLTSISVAEGNKKYDSRDNCNAIIETASNTLITGSQNSIIPMGVTSIGEKAFFDCSGLTSIIIPESVTSIGSGVFSGCSGLGSIIIPEGVTSIESAVFQGCSKLGSITIPSSVTSIKVVAFQGCSNLTSVTIPEGVKSIGNYAFDGCNGLKSIVFLGRYMPNIGNSVFSNCTSVFSLSINTSTIPSWVTSYFSEVKEVHFGEDVSTILSTFSGLTNLKEVTLGEKVTAIYDNAFQGCTALSSINLPSSLRFIGSNAFQNTGLTAITIPSSVTSLGSGAFGGCQSLASVTINMPTISTWFSGLRNLKNVTLGESVTAIEDNAFKGCTALSSINLPSSLLSIGSSAFQNTTLKSIELPASLKSIGTSAFANTELTSIMIPSSVTSLGGGVFSSCQSLASATINMSNVSSNFSGCTNLKQVTLGKMVTAIEDGAFNGCTALSSINLPSSLLSIGSSAFRNTGLTAITIPSSVTSLGSGAFGGCQSLASVTINMPTISTWFSGLRNLKNVTLGESVTAIEDNAFKGCTALSSINIPSGVKSIGASAFQNTALTAITLPNGITTLSNDIFAGCSSLTSFTIPESVTTIGDGAFQSTGLTAITIPASVTSIGWGAFDGCNKLASVNINMPSIDSWFSNLSSLKEVQLGESVTAIADYAFTNCTGMTSVTLGNKVTTIGTGAFSGCTGLTSFTMGSSVKTIGGEAFYNCTKLTALTIPEGVTSIGSNAINGCSSLGTLTINTPQVGTWFQGCPYFKQLVLGEKVVSIDNNAFRNCSKLSAVTMNLATVKPWFSNLTSLKEVTLGTNVKTIEASAFSGCSGVATLTIPENVSGIGAGAFNAKTSLRVKQGSKALLALWNAGYTQPTDAENGKALPATLLNVVGTTQCSATFKAENYYSEYKSAFEGQTYTGKEVKVSSLRPEETTDYSLSVSKDDVTYTTSASATTLGLNPTVNLLSKSPTTIAVSGSYDRGDARLVSQRIGFNGKETAGTQIADAGLEAGKAYPVSYSVTVRYGSGTDQVAEYTGVANITTDALELKTLPAKVVSSGNIVVAAESNITNDSEKVGFEWRRNDAPDEVASKSGVAYLYEGTMEGFLRNVQSQYYWKFRPYYEAASGVKVYGTWGIVAADDYSYFEPTVHTYATIVVEETEAEVKGYVMQGTDEVAEQGFVYWIVSDAGVKADFNAPHRAPSVPSNARTVKANGQVMTAKLSNLYSGTKYRCAAYVKTSTGKTFYGEEQSFQTSGTVVAIEEVNEDVSTSAPTIIVRYDLNGRRISKAQRGVNLLRMSDGTTRKVVVK